MAETTHFERAGVENGGIRIPACPRCGTPNVIPEVLRRATFGECAGDDCDAWLTYNVAITVVAVDERETAKYRFGTYVRDDE